MNKFQFGIYISDGRRTWYGLNLPKNAIYGTVYNTYYTYGKNGRRKHTRRVSFVCTRLKHTKVVYNPSYHRIYNVWILDERKLHKCFPWYRTDTNKLSLYAVGDSIDGIITGYDLENACNTCNAAFPDMAACTPKVRDANRWFNKYQKSDYVFSGSTMIRR